MTYRVMCLSARLSFHSGGTIMPLIHGIISATCPRLYIFECLKFKARTTLEVSIMREYTNIGKWGCRSQTNLKKPSGNDELQHPQIKNPCRIPSSCHLTPLPAGQALGSSPALPPWPCQTLLCWLCYPTISFPLFPLQLREFCASFSASLALDCQAPAAPLAPGCSHQSPAPFPVTSNVLSLFWFPSPLSQFTKHSAKLNINLPSAPSPRKVPPCSESCLANKASITRRIAILK